MKTPIQELIDKMLHLQRTLTDVSELLSTPSDTIQAKTEMLTDCIEFAELMLEKEKAVIILAANFDSRSIAENGYRKGEQYYNETFNTDDK
jgi:hypothetical protein